MLLLATVMLSSKFLSLLHEPPLQVKMHDFFMRDCQDWRYFSSFFGQWYCFDDKHWEAWNNRWISQWFFSSTNSSTFQKRPAQFSDLGVVVFLVAPHYFRQMESCLRALENNFFRFQRYPVIIFHSDNITSKSLMLKATRSPVAFELLSFTGWTFVKGSHLPHKYGYLHMCRFFSSKIWFHPATAHFRYIMRLDPHSFIASPLVPDPFIQMSIEKKRYAITFLWVERIDYSSGFLDLTWNFSRKHNFTIPPLFFNLFVGTNREYNQFQLYNNFFLADTEFFRKSDVLQYLRFVDEAGGHYTVRWGDSLVHSFVLGLFLHLNEILVLANFSYVHGQDFRCLTKEDCSMVDQYIGKSHQHHMMWIGTCNVRMAQFRSQCSLFNSLT